MDWRAGLAALVTVVIVISGRRWKDRRRLSLGAALAAVALLAFALVISPVTAALSLFGMSKEAESSVFLNLVVVGPMYLAPALLVAAFVLLPNGRWRLGVLLVLAALGLVGLLLWRLVFIPLFTRTN